MANLVSRFYGELWKAIIRPPRDEYLDEELGASKFKLSRDSKTFIRTDFDVLNDREEKLKCSHYEPVDRDGMQLLPCVIYLHGNCSSRIEAHCALSTLLPLNITVVGFDFAGSGRSDGEFVTLGWNEEEDLRAVVNHLRERRRVSSLGLWGRSMGAVAAMRYASKDALILAMVCDSPFSNLRQLAEEVASSFVWIPHNKISKLLVGPALYLVKNKIKDKSGLDIDKLDVIETVQESNVPVLIITGIDDVFVRSHHAKALYGNYKHHEKWYIEAEGDHNSQRSQRIMNSIGWFFYENLFCRLLFEDLNVARQLSLQPSCDTIFQGSEDLQGQREYNERNFNREISNPGASSGASSPSLTGLDVYISSDSTVTSNVIGADGSRVPLDLSSPAQLGPPQMRPPVRSSTQLPGGLRPSSHE
eukprot:Protomagalhaensia_sp_Gyna_25__1518@NODE_177_length_4608_cov_57_230904_g139_i0_p3_GENE_NODE_177_length_4608_cov_57_230904_g139_i0NODE_177_length_4608_cov_57_230904_g139_i0_p3_ORF_typecomplete_len417_score45_53Hydrolase_4/PF12146_8/9_2e25Peptidase_S15/PF02129_18/1_3e17Peptidase_S9/PF00326_21/1_1e13Abhydrolase_1/PF00561_20/2_6e12DUF1100/PF06500_11/9_9e11DUF818/PF05677_12/3_2e10Abhydrolase_6/PF12697_7/1_1e09Acyl_transf_2/PF02273_15/1_4e08DLH/PF01738_18/3e08BAAT_C/PF08840_11/2_4e07DUF1057/PF06342_12/